MEMLKVILFLTAISVNRIGSNETAKSMMSSFLKIFNECKHELNLGDNVLADMYHFWKQDHALDNRDTGCAIVCMSKKLNLLDDSGKLHHGNAQEFVTSLDVGTDMASKLVATVHECEGHHDDVEDPCLRALEVAKCFRSALQAMNWTLKMDVVITEVLTEK